MSGLLQRRCRPTGRKEGETRPFQAFRLTCFGDFGRNPIGKDAPLPCGVVACASSNESRRPCVECVSRTRMPTLLILYKARALWRALPSTYAVCSCFHYSRQAITSVG